MTKSLSVYAVALSTLFFSSIGFSQIDKENQLEFSKWSKDLNIPDPVAISFDDLGRAYVTQTTRRKANDLDIRNNRDWTVNDVSFQSVKEKLAFYHERLAPGLSDQNKKRVRDLNKDGKHDFNDLKVLSEKIHRVVDTDKDGFADQIELFADGFQTEVTGIAAGVLHFRDAENRKSVYATIAPDVWRLQDTDRDGKVDRREKVATGFGLHIAYAGHDMHGLTVGPDGKIYWSIGDKGISVSSKEGQKFHFPNQGGVMRCNPDGSDFEVFAHGLRNVQELAFDQYGNLFGVDNDADQPGERERFVYIVKDMDAGWRCHYQYRGNRFNPWTDEKLWQTFHQDQPAYIVPPIQYSINGPCGFVFNPGTALNDRYHNYFFLTGAPHGEQIAFKIETNGASFRVKDQHQIGKGVALIGINFGPDGALYGVDWANGYPLNQKGAIWKIDSSKNQNSHRQSTKEELQKDWTKESLENLVKGLHHPDQRVRLRAQFELVRREDHTTLANVAFEGNFDQLGRIHAIWGVGQLQRKKAVSMDWQRLLQDNDPEIQTQTLKIIAELDRFPADLLFDLFESDNPRVQFHLLMALAKHGNSNWLPMVIDLCSRFKPNEVYLRHAAAQALAGCELERSIDSAMKSKSEQVRLCAVVALRSKKSPGVAKFLTDQSEQVRTEAARAIHDDFSINKALSLLAAQANSDLENSDRFILRALSANFRIGKPANLSSLLKFANNAQQKSSLRLQAIQLIENWQKPDPLDPVTGRYRGLPTREISDETKSVLKTQLSRLLSATDARLQTAAVKTLRGYKMKIDGQHLLQIVSNPKSDEKLAVEAFKNLFSQDSELTSKALDRSLDSPLYELRLAAIEQLEKSDPKRCAEAITETFVDKKAASIRQRLIPIASRLDNPKIEQFLVDLFAKYASDNAFAAESLELLTAIKGMQQNDSAKKALKSFQQKVGQPDGDKKLGDWQVCLDGGDRDAGKRLFETHIDAQCIRCHRVGKTGSTVGPKLDGIAKKRDPLHLLRAIIHPSADIEKEYQTVKVATFSGQFLTGVKVEENDDQLIIADAMGKKITIEKDDIEELGVNNKSIMPEMTKSLSRKEVRDLVAYLRSLN